MVKFYEQDRQETEHYLEDINKDTPYLVLDDDYVEFKRAVLNYSPILQVRDFERCKTKPIEKEPIKDDVWKGTYLIISSLGIDEFPLIETQSNQMVHGNMPFQDLIEDDISWFSLETQDAEHRPDTLSSDYRIISRQFTKPRIRVFDISKIKEFISGDWLLESDFKLNGKSLTDEDILKGAKLEFQTVADDGTLSKIWFTRVGGWYKHHVVCHSSPYTYTGYTFPKSSVPTINGKPLDSSVVDGVNVDMSHEKDYTLSLPELAPLSHGFTLNFTDTDVMNEWDKLKYQHYPQEVYLAKWSTY